MSSSGCTYDAWSSPNVLLQRALAQAREVRDALCVDRGCHAAGTMGVDSLLAQGPGGLRTVATQAFQQSG